MKRLLIIFISTTLIASCASSQTTAENVQSASNAPSNIIEKINIGTNVKFIENLFGPSNSINGSGNEMTWNLENINFKVYLTGNMVSRIIYWLDKNNKSTFQIPTNYTPQFNIVLGKTQFKELYEKKIVSTDNELYNRYFEWNLRKYSAKENIIDPYLVLFNKYKETKEHLFVLVSNGEFNEKKAVSYKSDISNISKISYNSSSGSFSDCTEKDCQDVYKTQIIRYIEFWENTRKDNNKNEYYRYNYYYDEY